MVAAKGGMSADGSVDIPIFGGAFLGQSSLLAGYKPGDFGLAEARLGEIEKQDCRMEFTTCWYLVMRAGRECKYVQPNKMR